MIDQAKAVADAVLYEGFLLFPYHKAALKNRMPWQFGVLMPRNYADKSEPSSLRSQMVVLSRAAHPEAGVLIRFLQQAGDPIEREVPLHIELCEGRTKHPFAIESLRGTAIVEIARDGDVLQLTFELHNESECVPNADRNTALDGAFISAHALLTARGAVFVSLLDPPDEAKEAVTHCLNERVFPVLVGDAGNTPQTAATILVSPIILYDFPRIANASTTHTFDATEIDELLMLSVATLTDDEKEAARSAHPYVRQLVERAEALDADTQAMLHGELTGGAPQPGDESVEITGRIVRKGSRVRVHPKGRTDVWDDIVRGMTGRVCMVHTDFEGNRYIGVVFDADPAGDLHEWYGRAFYYGPDEVEPQ